VTTFPIDIILLKYGYSKKKDQMGNTKNTKNTSQGFVVRKKKQKKIDKNRIQRNFFFGL